MKSIVTVAFCLIGSSALADHELTARNLERGRGLYASQCASCHGANLEGQANWQTPDENGVLPAPPHDETGHTWHHNNALLFDYTKLGGAEALDALGVIGFNSGMPSFADALTDDEIWDILGYIRSTWPQRIQDVQSDRNPADHQPAP